ncbi:MAG: hypothetical protein M1617_01870 [Actinobacteria bacterium]|nr:hypothetical protein [Actinomycetota bacterium]
MGKFKDFESAGAADLARVRIAHGVDGVIAILAAVLLLPFPTIRAAVPIPVFVAIILATMVFVHALYLAISVTLWGRTVGMYLFDLGIAKRPVGTASAMIWAAASVVGFLPGIILPRTLDPILGWPAKISGLTTEATTAKTAE